MADKYFYRNVAGAFLKGCAVMGVALGVFLHPAEAVEVLAAGEPGTASVLNVSLTVMTATAVIPWNYI